MPHFAKALEEDLQTVNQLKALNPLVARPDEDLQPTARTAIGYARLLNEARILLDRLSNGAGLHHVGPDINRFEARCREQVGPIVEKVPK